MAYKCDLICLPLLLLSPLQSLPHSLSSIWRGHFYIKLELILTKYRGIQREGGGKVVKEKVKGVKYMEMEEDLTLGCGYTMQYKDDVS